MKFDWAITTNPADELVKAFNQNNIELPPTPFEFNGHVHRFRADPSKPKDNDNGWYVMFERDGFVNGVFGDWASGTSIKFHSSGFESLSLIEKSEINRKIQEAIKQQDEEKAKVQQSVSESCEELWKTLQEAPSDYPYLVLKGLKNGHGARLEGDRLVIPLKDKEGRIWSLQYISANGEKKYKKNGKCKGMFWTLGNGEPRYLCEGFATACSIYEATGKTTIMSYSAGNLKDVAKQFPNTLLIADNDESKTGEIKAKETGNKYFLIPEVGCDANDYAHKHGNEALAKLLDETSSRYDFVDGSEWLIQSKPKEWLIKGMILKGKTISMIFGKSGNGKTFVVIEMMMSLVTGISTCFDGITKKSKVLYLCGEGDESVKERMAVWSQQHGNPVDDIRENLKIEPLSFSVEDNLTVLTEAAQKCGFTPDIIFVDTLACYMGGDENDTKSAKMFIEAIKNIQYDLNCGIVLIHHTGQAEETQKRERGSSVFKGALDMQLRVDKNADGIISIVNSKNKGGKELERKSFKLEDHKIDGFIEDDGSSVSCAIMVPCSAEEVKETKVDKYTHLMIQLFIDGGYLVGDEPRISRDKAREIIRLQKVEETPIEPGESEQDFEKRIGNNVRQVLKRIFSENPYVEVVRKDDKGNPIEYACKGVYLDGVTEPNFTMKVARDSF